MYSPTFLLFDLESDSFQSLERAIMYLTSSKHNGLNINTSVSYHTVPWSPKVWKRPSKVSKKVIVKRSVGMQSPANLTGMKDPLPGWLVHVVVGRRP
jgi:hypothetical protein